MNTRSSDYKNNGYFVCSLDDTSCTNLFKKNERRPGKNITFKNCFVSQI